MPSTTRSRSAIIFACVTCITAPTQPIPRRAFRPSSHPRLRAFISYLPTRYIPLPRTLSNEFRLGYNRFFTQLDVPAINFPGLSQFPDLIFYDLSTTTYLGPDASAPQSDIQNLYQAIDSLTWIKGRHTLVFGVEGRKYIAPTVFVQRLRGDYEYSTLGRYLNDISPDAVGQRNATPPGVSPTFYGDQSSIYAYANDDFRMTQKLTLNLGLRYEFTSVPASEKEQALNIAASVPGLITFGKPTPQYKNFAAAHRRGLCTGREHLSPRCIWH